MRAARAASETNSATNAQIYETAAQFVGLLSVRRTRPAYGRTSDTKGLTRPAVHSRLQSGMHSGIHSRSRRYFTGIRTLIHIVHRVIHSPRTNAVGKHGKRALRRRPRCVEKAYFEKLMHKDEAKQSKFQ